MNTQTKLDQIILIAVQAPHPTRFGAVSLSDLGRRFYSEPITPESRTKEFNRFTVWKTPLRISGFAAWGTERLSFLQEHLGYRFAGEWFDLYSFAYGFGAAGNVMPVLPQVLEDLVEVQVTQACALIKLYQQFQQFSIPPLGVPTLARLES